MNALILYATKHGAVKEIAEKIADAMGGAEVCDLKGQAVPALDGYDRVIIGGSLYAGMLRKEAKAFAAEREAALLEKTVGLFLSGLRDTDTEQYFQTNFPQALLEKAKAKRFMGGIYDPGKCGFVERTLLKLLGQKGYENNISQEAIQAFAKEMEA